MAEHIGSVYVEVLPDAEGFANRFRAQALPQIDALGREAGQRFAREFVAPLERALPDVFRRTRAHTTSQSQQSGRAAGDAFGRQLDERITAAIRALPSRIDFGADVSEAERKLGMVRASLDGLSDSRMRLGMTDAEVVEKLKVLKAELKTLTGPGHDIRVRFNASAAAAEIAALQASLETLDKKADLAKPKKNAQSLMSVLLTLAPAIVPIAGAALAGGAALGVMGVSGILAVRGIKAEMKSGTPVGLEFAGGLRTAKDDLTVLQSTAAKGVLGGFDDAIGKATAELPAFNDAIGQSSKGLGDIGGHVIGGLVGGFDTFAPLVQKVESYVDGLASTFEHWAGGSGGEGFAKTLSADFDELVPLLEQLGPLAVKFLSSLNTGGSGELALLTDVTSILNDIPVGVLKAGTTAYIAFRTAVAVTSGLRAATLALEGFAGAETTAAAATTEAAAAQGAAGAGGLAARAGILQRTAGGLAAVTTRLLPYAAAWVAASVAVNSASSATRGWASSTDSTKAFVGAQTNFLSKILGGHFISAFSGEARDARASNNAEAAQSNAQQMINRLGVGPGGSKAGVQNLAAQRAELTRLHTVWQTSAADLVKLNHAQNELTASGRTRSAAARDNAAAIEKDSLNAKTAAAGYYKMRDAIDAQRASLKADAVLRAEVARSADKYASANDDVLGARLRNTFAQNPSLTAGVTGLQAYAKGVYSAAKAEETWTKVTDDNTVKIGKTTYETKAWQRALEVSGGNAAKAAGLLEGHTRALAADQLEAGGAAVMQQRLSSAIGAAEDKYKLNDTQLNIYAATLGITSERLATGEVSQDQFVAAVGRVKKVLDEGDTSLQGWVAALGQFESGTDTAASRAQLLSAAMVAMNGTAISYGQAGATAAAANQQFVDDFSKAKAGVVNLKTGFIDFHNAGAAPLLNDLGSLQSAAANFAAATYQNEVATKGRTQASKDAAAVYYNDTHRALTAEAAQLHITGDQAGKLADRYFHWPKNAATQIELMGTEGTNKLLDGIGQQLAILTGKPWISTLTADPESAKGKIADLTARINAIKQNRVPGLDADSAAAAAKIDALQAKIDRLRGKTVTINYTEEHHGTGNTRSPGVAGRAGHILRAFAGGGIEDHRASIYKAAPANHVRIFAEPDTGDESYIPLANDWRRPRAKAIALETVKRLGGHAFFEAGGFTGVTAGPGPKTAKTASTKTPSTKADTSALTSFLQALGIGTSTFTQAKDQLLSALRSSKVSTDQLAVVTREADRLIADAKRVATETARINKAQTYLSGLKQQSAAEVSTVRSSILSLFDLSSAGVQKQVYRDKPAPGVTGDSILASLTSSADTAVNTKAELAKLRGHIPDALYEELAGNASQDQDQIAALSKSSGSTLSAITKQYGRLSSTATGTGKDVAGRLFGSKIDTAEALLNGVDPKKNPALAAAVAKLSSSLFGAGKETARGLAMGLKAEKHSLVAAMHDLAHTLEDQIKKDLHIKSPSRKMHLIGQQVTRGLVNGIVAELPAVRAATTRVSAEIGASSPNGAALTRAEDHFHFHGLDDPGAQMAAFQRRKAHSGRG